MGKNENVIPELWKRYILNEIRVDLSGKGWTNEQKMDHSEWTEKTTHCNSRAFFFQGKSAD